MTSTMEQGRTPAATSPVTMDQSSAVQVAAAYLLRYGLVLVIAWIGFMKFTAYEAAGIGASHQTGWTGLVAKLLQQSGE